MKNITVLLLFLVTLVLSSGDYTKIIHNTDPQAKCLDGSDPMIYLHEGGDTKNILFHMIGGGACLGTDLPSTLQSCYKRSKGQFGSSTKWPDTYPGKDGGVLSTDPAQNTFANWTKIVMIYCDGVFHQGNNKSPVQYKDKKLYFRGAVNTRSHFKWANNKYNLSSAERIVLTGSSAGAMAVTLYHQYLKDMVPNPQRVFSIADSGIFYDPVVSILPEEQALERILKRSEGNLLTEKSEDLNPIQILMQLANADEKPPNKQCSDLFDEDEQWKCLFVEFNYATLKSPILFLESSYDEFIFQAVYGFKCLKQGASGKTMKNCADWQINAIQLYRTFYLEKFVPKLLKFGHSLWTISCVWHAGMFQSEFYDSPLQKVPKNDGRTMRNATDAFVFNHKRIQSIDFFPYPANTPCAY